MHLTSNQVAPCTLKLTVMESGPLIFQFKPTIAAQKLDVDEGSIQFWLVRWPGLPMLPCYMPTPCHPVLKYGVPVHSLSGLSHQWGFSSMLGLHDAWVP